LAEKKEKDEEQSESEAPSDSEEEEQQDSEDEISSDEEELIQANTKPYAALLQTLAADHSAPAAKRRKLDTAQMDGSDSEGEEDEEEHLKVDEVDEDEEGPETAIEGADDDDEDASDPFEAHFANPDDNLLSRRLANLKTNVWSQRKVTVKELGKAQIAIPEADAAEQATMPAPIQRPDQLRLKQKLVDPFTKQKANFNAEEQTIASAMFNYRDLLYCERTTTNAKGMRRLACLHAVNHVFKTRDRVIKNNARLAKEEGNIDLDLRDQGFTRPKVLYILPTRESCVRMVDMITSLIEPDQQENRKRFNDTYVVKEDKFSADKTEDFRELFAGNDDDMFRLGLKFTRKTIKYFSQFYNSDIIFASPLGLRMAIGAEDSKKIDADFLSSIEMVIVDQADALLMQNWEHVEFIFEHLNLQPKEAHGCDFSRVRSWYLDNDAKYFRQTIALAAFNTPELNNLFYNQSKNWAGKIKISATYPGALTQLPLKVKQTFSRLDAPSIAGEPDARFAYFTTAIVPIVLRHAKEGGILLFVPSYLDFVRVRNYFGTSAQTQMLSFGSISEYSSVKDVARARSHFQTGRFSVILYTERAHHFRRYQIRGVKRIIMYGLPDNPIFYKEIVGGYLGRSVQEGKLEPGQGSCRSVFSKYDALKLERIAGTERVGKMIMEKGDTFDFL
jgi:U3 small nucleolar RNA-associated protein 25